MTIIITAIIIALAIIGVVETRTTNSNTKTSMTDMFASMPHIDIQSFEDWCAQHPEQEAVERPSLFMPLPELTNGLQHIDIPSFDEWCEHHIVDTDGDRPSLFMPVADLTNSLPGLGGTTFTQWCDKHPVVEYVHADKVCALEVQADVVSDECGWEESPLMAFIKWREQNPALPLEKQTKILSAICNGEEVSDDDWEEEYSIRDVLDMLFRAVPKDIALKVMNTFRVDEIVDAGRKNNVGMFMSVKGIGPKRADKIVKTIQAEDPDELEGVPVTPDDGFDETNDDDLPF